MNNLLHGNISKEMDADMELMDRLVEWCYFIGETDEAVADVICVCIYQTQLPHPYIPHIMKLLHIWPVWQWSGE